MRLSNGSLRWMELLMTQENELLNLEREHTDRYPTLRYTLRALEIFAAHAEGTDEEAYVETALKWMDVAKCGSASDRARWAMLSINREIHNEASAVIYREESGETDEKTLEIVTILVRTHGMLGQFVRGESPLIFSRDLLLLSDQYGMEEEALRKLLKLFNRAIIEAVSPDIWEKVAGEIDTAIERLLAEEYGEELQERCEKIFPIYRNVPFTEEDREALSVIEGKSLWYPEVSFEGFTVAEIRAAFGLCKGFSKASQISFYGLAKELNSGVSASKNIYKHRIVEHMLRNHITENEHARFVLSETNGILYFGIEFSEVCRALIDFCVKSEQSGIATYEQNVLRVFDLFGLRRDEFDRLANEAAYLDTMNNAEESTKLSLLDYATGNVLVDVGSGGGVMLKALRKQFPQATVIGTDISESVIQHLISIGEDAIVHNFVEGPLPDGKKADTIIFSSILHEIYSYTERDGKHFQLDSVKLALKNALASLSDRGRILIRDGVLVGENRNLRIRMKDEGGVAFLQNYLRDFKGLSEYRDASGEWNCVDLDGDIFEAPIDLVREFMFTYTWGPASYPQEVQEQFGYFSKADYEAFLQEIGMKVITSREVVEPGYEEHLAASIELLDGADWKEIPTNVIIIAEKA